MIHVDFDPAQLTGEQKEWWHDWSERADKATLAEIEAWEDSNGATSTTAQSCPKPQAA